MDEQQNANAGMPQANGGSSAGPIIAVVVILAIVILGGFYFWGQSTMEDETNTENDASLDIQLQGNTDDLNSIESDLDATDIESLDSEINAS